MTFLATMIVGNGTGDQEVERPFKKRKKRFRDEARIAFAAQPILLKSLLAFTDNFDEIYLRRNILAHGLYSMEVDVKQLPKDRSPTVVIRVIAEGYVNNKPVQMRFTYDELREACYNASLILDAAYVFNGVRRPLSFRGPSEEISALHSFLGPLTVQLLLSWIYSNSGSSYGEGMRLVPRRAIGEQQATPP